MFVFFVNRIRIEVQFLFFATLTLWVLLDPTGVALLGVVASLLHECGHLLLLWQFGCKPRKIAFELGGIAVIKSGYQLPPTREVLVLAAGSLTNFLLALLFFSHSPTFAAINLLVGGFNLLPLSMLDGGKLLAILCDRTFSVATALRIMTVVQGLTVGLLCLLVGCLLRQGMSSGWWVVLIAYLLLLLLHQYARFGRGRRWGGEKAKMSDRF